MYRNGGHFMEIGGKIKHLRLKLGLTQEELADRCELSKGFISQVERDLTSPSIATLVDILECLGATLHSFFSDDKPTKVVYTPADRFEKEDTDALTGHVTWLVPNAQGQAMEPILVRLAPGGATPGQDPHEGEEFGYVLQGTVDVEIGGETSRARAGDSFYYSPDTAHRLVNAGRGEARVIWVSSPPSF